MLLTSANAVLLVFPLLAPTWSSDDNAGVDARDLDEVDQAVIECVLDAVTDSLWHMCGSSLLGHRPCAVHELARETKRLADERIVDGLGASGEHDGEHVVERTAARM